MKKIFLIIVCIVPQILYAETEYEQRIASYKQSTSSHVERMVRIEYSDWAKSYIAMNDFSTAAEVYQKALQDTFLRADDHAFIATELAALYNNHLLMHQSAMQLLENYHFSSSYRQPWIWSLRMAQTKMYLHQYDEASALLDSIINEMPTGRSDVYATRGYLNMKLGKYQVAIDDLNKALEVIKDDTNKHRILSNISSAKAEIGDYTEAIAKINDCIEFARGSHNEGDLSIYYRKRAQIYLLKGDTAAAVADYRTYWEREKQYIIDNFSKMSEQQRLDYWANRKPIISGAFRLGNYDPAFLADVSIFRHQAALLGIHDTTPAIIRSRMEIDAKRVQKCLTKDEVAIEFVKYKNEGTWQYTAIVVGSNQVNLVPICKEEQLPIDAICSSSVDDKDELYSSAKLGSIIWGPLLPYIKGKKDIWFAPDGVLNMLAIEYLEYPDSNKPSMHRLTSTGMLVQRSKHAKRQSVNALLIGGLDYDQMDTDHPTLAPTNQNGLHYWKTTRNSLALFTYLPGSRAEVDSIVNNIAHWVRTYKESEEMLKEEFGQFNLVHLSTHGYSLDVSVAQPDEIMSDSITTDNSLLGSGFALTGANVSYRYPYRDDGLLTAREICELDLRNVNFVVASACQSAQGRISDEGPAGLLRSLKLAGVGCVMATLWPVDDDATTLFMHYFYEAWQNGNRCSKQQALLYAQQRLRQYGTQSPRTKRTFSASKLRGEYQQTQSPIYNAPYYWAPFILVDDLETNK